MHFLLLLFEAAVAIFPNELVTRKKKMKRICNTSKAASKSLFFTAKSTAASLQFVKVTNNKCASSLKVARVYSTNVSPASQTATPPVSVASAVAPTTPGKKSKEKLIILGGGMYQRTSKTLV